MVLSGRGRIWLRRRILQGTCGKRRRRNRYDYDDEGEDEGKGTSTQGQGQQFGTYFQAGAGGGVVVDSETDSAGFEGEIDHAAGFVEAVHFTHGQNVSAFESFDDLRQARLLGSADEE